MESSLDSLKKRMTAVKKTSSGNEGLLSIKANIDYLKKEVASLRYIDLSNFWDGLEDSIQVDINIALNDGIDVDVAGVGSEETKATSTLKINEYALGVKLNKEEH